MTKVISTLEGSWDFLNTEFTAIDMDMKSKPDTLAQIAHSRAIILLDLDEG